MENSPNPKFNLIDHLPIELFNYVFSRFCFHCHSPESIKDREIQYQFELRFSCRNLLALTQTSKRCRTVAMPILFHQVGYNMTLRYMLQILDRDRDLAQDVKVLHLPYRIVMTDGCRSALYKTASTLAGTSISYRLDLENPYNTLINTLLGFLFNLQGLIIKFYEQGIDLGFLGKILARRGSEAGFANLKYLELEAGDCVAFSAAGPGLPLLLQQIPRLETLVLKNGGRAEFPSYGLAFNDPKCNIALQNLKDLQIHGWYFHEGCNDRHTLFRILRTAKDLTRFKYVVDKGPGSNTEEMPQVHHVLPKKLLSCLNLKKLQHLHIHFKLSSTGPYHLAQTYVDLQNPPPFPSTIITREQLGRFTNITSLTLDPLCFCRHVSEGTLHRKESSHQKTCLTDLLTPTIRDLTLLLKGDDMRWICWDDILYLGQKARDGAFPGLQTVKTDITLLGWGSGGVGGWDGGWNNQHMQRIPKPFKAPEEEFHAAFEGSGVVAKIEGRMGGCRCGKCQPNVYVPLDGFVVEEG